MFSRKYVIYMAKIIFKKKEKYFTIWKYFKLIKKNLVIANCCCYIVKNIKIENYLLLVVNFYFSYFFLGENYFNVCKGSERK